ncbi:MAG: AAA family ATPase [Methanobrevibacter sp.]|uniref:AAA family ATPase n=1 Tax=uncultured Methanobrevibacter sp. TaxID=253161 RepID=UPI0025ECE2EF|nr:AAA family ATPase [uncultured Methanobrevibacter sp.]MEE1128431.1 AAA family ATPase [Methanobrevibacter sp.]
MKTDNKKAEIKSTNQKSAKVENENKEYAECVVLKAVGYPFDFNLMENDFKITNKKLFEEYAREQWLGLEVNENSYLFDQKIIPDYGFEIITAKPNGSIISEKTKIKLIDEEISKSIDEVKINNSLRLSDIVGQKNAKNKVKVLIKYLEDPDKFGPWAPKNILFYGMPGTGKTMLVKALANELDVPLHLIKATSLIGEHVGDSASKIHELFKKANEKSPSIIFIDEIDAIALHRSFQALRGDVSEIVNSLLTEMDGIYENKSVITIGATNNPTSLDYAVRSRFEEEIEFNLPNDEERKEILEKNLKTMPLEHDLNLDKIVKMTKGMSGRDIKEKILKTSLHNAIANDQDVLSMKNIDYAIQSAKIKNTEVKGMYE